MALSLGVSLLLQNVIRCVKKPSANGSVLSLHGAPNPNVNLSAIKQRAISESVALGKRGAGGSRLRDSVRSEEVQQEGEEEEDYSGQFSSLPLCMFVCSVFSLLLYCFCLFSTSVC